ncbi:FIG00732302: hypothetical protein [Klebsiella pneumoniae IS43]|uniref:Uncharacterized protein n=1 Tax=Klebsiella pneumoniae IS43 TaxID=1432552 RepID=W1DTH9_KLEPN|nr:FIG00732302: hypothetical protein [Klebsiella pneumoniae IS43]
MIPFLIRSASSLASSGLSPICQASAPGYFFFYFLNLNHENSFVIVNEKKSYPFFNMSGPNIIGDIIL